MSLGTGEVINRAPGYWTEVVISDTVIGRVEALAKHQGQPMIQDSNLMVEYSPDQPIKDDKYDGDYEPADGQDSDEESLDDSVVSITQELSNDEDVSTADPSENDTISSIDNPPPISEQEAPVEPEEDHDLNEIVEEETETPSTPGAAEDPKNNHHDIDEISHTAADVTTEQEVDSEPEQEPPPAETPTDTGYQLRGNRNRSYNYRFANAVDNPHHSKSYYPDVQLLQHTDHQTSCKATPELKKQVCGFILTQMTAKVGIKRFGDPARQAMREEFKELDDKGVFEPMRPKDVTMEMRKQAL